MKNCLATIVIRKIVPEYEEPGVFSIPKVLKRDEKVLEVKIPDHLFDRFISDYEDPKAFIKDRDQIKYEIKSQNPTMNLDYTFYVIEIIEI